MLGEVEETIYLVEDDDEEDEEVKVSVSILKRVKANMLRRSRNNPRCFSLEVGHRIFQNAGFACY